jgi:hypothetical protein
MICGGLSERQIAEYEPDYRLHLLIINAVYDILPQPIAEEISCNIHPWHLSIQNYSPLHPRRRPDYSGVLACHDELVRGLPERYPHAYWLPLRLSMNMTASITKQLDYETAEAYLAGLE